MAGSAVHLLMMPQTPVSVARQRSERLRKEFEALCVIGRDMQATLSFGIAGFPDHGSESIPLLQLADEALYAAQQRGRNCIVDAGQLIRAVDA